MNVHSAESVSIENGLFEGGLTGVTVSSTSNPQIDILRSTFFSNTMGIDLQNSAHASINQTLMYREADCISGDINALVAANLYSDICDFSEFSGVSSVGAVAAVSFQWFDINSESIFWDLSPAMDDDEILDQLVDIYDLDGTYGDIGYGGGYQQYYGYSGDSDGDGLEDGREIFWFGTLNWTNDRDADLDGDGFSTFQEFSVNTDPLDITSF